MNVFVASIVRTSLYLTAAVVAASLIAISTYSYAFAQSAPAISGSITTAPVNTAASSVSFPHTVNEGQNQILIVTTGASGVGEDTSATYNGVPMLRGTTTGNGTSSYYGYWYLVNPPQGTYDVIVNFPFSPERLYTAMTVDNVDQVTPFSMDAHVGRINNADATVPITTTVPNEFILYFINYDDGLNGFTANDAELYNVQNSPPSGNRAQDGAAHVQATPGTVQVGGTVTGPVINMSWDLVAIAIRPVQNRAPILDAIGNRSVAEGQTLTFTLEATDPDGDTLTYSATNLPAGATFNSATRTFSWTPSFAQAGNYDDVEFTVTDSGSPMELDFEGITITVGNVNRAPVFEALGSQEVLENNPLSFSLQATDQDLDTVSLSASGVPTGATFNSSTGEFSWTPTLAQAGVYVVSITATDDGLPAESSVLDVVITVGDNPTPTEQAENIIDVVVIADLPTNIENSYLANLNKVGTFIENGQVQAAINQLNAFIHKVNNDYAQSKITLAQRDSFVSLAQNLISALQ